MIKYGFKKTVEGNYEEVLEKVKEELKKEGFGVLTFIDVKETLKQKLGVDFKKYAILGACNPPYSYKALMAEEDIGLLLPCNVIVYEKEDKTVVAAINPTVAMSMIDNDELKNIAVEVEDKLKKVLDAI